MSRETLTDCRGTAPAVPLHGLGWGVVRATPDGELHAKGRSIFAIDRQVGVVDAMRLSCGWQRLAR